MCKIKINIAATDFWGSGLTVEGQYRATGSLTWVTYGGLQPINNAYTPDLTTQGDYELRVRVIDGDGKISDWFNFTNFSIDGCAPKFNNDTTPPDATLLNLTSNLTFSNTELDTNNNPLITQVTLSWDPSYDEITNTINLLYTVEKSIDNVNWFGIIYPYPDFTYTDVFMWSQTNISSDTFWYRISVRDESGNTSYSNVISFNAYPPQ